MLTSKRRSEQQVKPETIIDIQVLLCKDHNIDVKVINKMDFFQAKYRKPGKKGCLIKPKQRLSRTVWMAINRKVREWGGEWAMGMWMVPLNG